MPSVATPARKNNALYGFPVGRVGRLLGLPGQDTARPRLPIFYQGASGISTATFASAPTKGHVLVCIAAHRSTGTAFTSIAGGGVTTWTQVADRSNSTVSHATIWVGVVDTTPSASVAIGVSTSTPEVWVTEWDMPNGGLAGTPSYSSSSAIDPPVTMGAQEVAFCVGVQNSTSTVTGVPGPWVTFGQPRVTSLAAYCEAYGQTVTVQFTLGGSSYSTILIGIS